jgi:methionine aminopeptidase
MGIPIKNSREADKMRVSCRVAGQVLERIQRI